MKQILTLKSQTIFDIAIQEYGNVEAFTQILEDNNLDGLNEFPAGVLLPFENGFNVCYPFREGITLNITENIALQNMTVKKQLPKDVIS